MNSRPRFFSLLVALVALPALGCQPEAVAPSPDVGTVDQSLTGTSCDVDDAYQPAAADCTGGWQFEPPCEHTNKACGFENSRCEPENYGTCMAFAGMAEQTVTFNKRNGTCPASAHKDLLAPWWWLPDRHTYFGFPRESYDMNKVLALPSPYYFFNGWPGWDLADQPGAYAYRNVRHAGSQCKAEVQILAYRRKSSACKCERITADPRTCDTAAQACSPQGNADWGYVGPGATRSTVDAVRSKVGGATAPVCLSCEDMPLTNLAAKLACLEDNLAEVNRAEARGILEPSRNRMGMDYKNFAVADAKACVRACNAETACKAATFVSSNKRCWLKNQVPGSSAGSGMTSYVKHTAALQASVAPIVAQLKLTLELAGERMSEAQLASLRGYYTSHSTAHAACSPDAPISSAHPELTSITGIGGVSLPYCEAMLMAHVPAELRAKEFRRCADVLDTVAQNLGAQPAIARDVGDLLTQLYVAQLDVMPTGTAAAALPFQLTLLQEWLTRWDSIAQVAGRGDERDAAISAVKASLWAQLYELEVPASELLSQLGATDVGRAQADLLAEFSKQSLSVGARTVAAAASPQSGPSPDGLPLPGFSVEPLLLGALLEDAADSLVAELNALSAYHDVACAVLGSCQAAPTASPLAGYWTVLGAVGDSGALTSALDLFGPGLGDWNAAFSALANHYPRLSAGVTALRERDGGSKLDGLVRTAARRGTAFADVGIFDPDALKTLSVGMDRADRTRVLAAAQTAHTTLDQGIESHEAGLERLLTVGLQHLESTHMVARVEEDRARQVAEYDQTVQRLAGLQAATDASERAFGSLAQAWERIEHTVDAGKLRQIGDSHGPLTVPSNGGRFVPGEAATPGQLAVSGAFIVPDLRRGQMLTVDAAGSYEPACAVNSTPVINPHGLGAPAPMIAAECGPEGYRGTVAGGQYYADSQSEEIRTAFNTTIGARSEACATTGLLGAAAGIEAKACGYVDTSFSFADSHVGSSVSTSDVRRQVSFSHGLRIPGTPFSDAPAGALLVVLTDGEGATYDVAPVRSGSSSILIRRPNTTAHFVVNDMAHCASLGASSLNVSWRVLESEGAVAAAMIDTMQAVIDEFAGNLATYVSQGRISASELAAHRQWAQLELRAALEGPGGVPESAQALFDAFLDKELANLERRVQIAVVEDDLDLRLLALASGDAQRRRAETVQGVRQLLSRRVVQQMNGALLRAHTLRTVAIAHTELLPVLRLWYPSALERLQTSAALHQLRAVDVGMSTHALATLLRGALTELLAEYSTSSRGDEKPSAPEPAFAALAFPRPRAAPLDDGLGGGLGDGFDPLGPPISEFLPVADVARSKLVWDAIDNQDWGLFRVRPEDIYGHGDGRISCTANVPVIEHVALFVIRPYASDNDALNQQLRQFEVEASSEQPFPSASGWDNYQLRNGIWTQYEIPVFYASPSEVLRVIDTNPRMNTQPPVGLSLFGDVEIDFAELGAIEDVGGRTGIDEDATAVVLAYRLGWRSGTRLNWVESCHD